MRPFTKLLMAMALASVVRAQAPSPPTQILDTITSPSGPNPSGNIIISWGQYQNNAIPRQTIYPGSITLPVVNGAVNVSLFPNALALPISGCYQVSYRLNLFNMTRYWYVPASSVPVSISEVEGQIPCATTSGALVAPGQIGAAGAVTGQALIFNGQYWAPGNGGGGGAGNPGGTNGQIQFNLLGSFGGFTPGGDVSFARPNFTVLSTNGVAFAPSATTNALNAANINVCCLGVAFGGTGTNTLSGFALTSQPLSQFVFTTSAQLRSVISDPNGTGSLVFGTNSTFVNPALGTPASGIATNITGLPLTTGVVGVLQPSNGGTGIANTSTLTLGTSSVNLSTLGTGIVKNTTITGALTDAASTDVLGLWTGTCNTTTFLRGDGSCQVPVAIGGGYDLCASGCSSTIPATGTTITAATHGQGVRAWAFAADSSGNEIAPPNFSVVRDSSGDLTINYITAPSYIAILGGGAGGGGGSGAVGWKANGSALGTSSNANFASGSGITIAGTFPGSVATYTISPDTTVLQTKANLQTGTSPTVIVSSSGSPSTYTASAGVALTAYSANQSFRWTVDTTNTCTSACTLNINGLGAKTVSDAYGNALQTGELGGGSQYTITYTGSKFLCSECRNLFTSSFQGLVPASGGGTTNYLRADGTWQPVSGGSGINQLTGDVTAGPGLGSQAATIAAGAVTLAKMANISANSILGNNTGSPATPIAMTQTQVTAMLNQFTSSLQGMVPGSGGGTSNFLRADGSWAVPAGTGTVTIASGTASLGTGSISSGSCASTVTVSASGVLSTDSIAWNPNASIKAVTGYVPSTSGGLSIAAYPTSGNVSFDVCNWSNGSITPGSITLNWRVTR